MPQFILNREYSDRAFRLPSHPYYALDEFAQGYVEAMFFTNGDTGNEERENHLNELGVSRLTRVAVSKIAEDCARFLASPLPDYGTVRDAIDKLAECEARYGEGVNSDTRAGHMFWYSRQGHGVDWSDDYSPGVTGYAIARDLSAACSAFGECYVEVWRGWIYVC